MSDLNVGAQKPTLVMENNKCYMKMLDANGKEVKIEVDASIFTQGQQAEKKENMNIPGLTVERSKYENGEETEKAYTGLNEATIEEGEGMRSRKEYKQMRKDIQADLKDYFEGQGYDDYKNKYARQQAKDIVNTKKAADRVISSEYYTDKAAYKAAKKANPDLRHVLLTDSDMEILRDKEWDEAFVGRERDENGNIVKEGTLDSTKLKQVAAERIGWDNKLEMEERVSESATFADEVGLKNGKVLQSHGIQNRLKAVRWLLGEALRVLCRKRLPRKQAASLNILQPL